MSLEEEKTRLEIAELKQKIRTEPYRLAVTVFGVALVLIGLGVERVAQARDRAFGIALDQHRSRLARMVEVAESTDALCQASVTAIDVQARKEVFDSLILGAWVDELRGIAINDAELALRLQKTITELEATQEALFDAGNEVDLWKDAVDLQARWNGLQTPSPDFALIYGSDLLAGWATLRDTADRAISEEFEIFGDGSSGVNLTEACARYTQGLREKIAEREVAFCRVYSERRGVCGEV